MFLPFADDVPHPSRHVVLRPLGEQLHDLARRAHDLAAENPAWIAPSQVVAAQHLAEAAIVLRSHAEMFLRQSHGD